MTTATMIHGIKSATAQQADMASWLRLEAEDGSYVAVFMPIETARRMEVAFAPDRADFDDGNITDVAAE